MGGTNKMDSHALMWLNTLGLILFSCGLFAYLLNVFFLGVDRIVDAVIYKKVPALKWRPWIATVCVTGIILLLHLRFWGV